MSQGPELTPELRDRLQMDGYVDLKVIPGRGICALMRFAFTIGLVYGIDETGYRGRWCYNSIGTAIRAFEAWNGVDDPPEEWIKYKGEGGERSRIPNEYDDEQ